MKPRATSRNGGGRRPLQSRSAENLTSCNKHSSHEANAQVGVGRCRSAHELVTDSQRGRELYSPSRGSCATEASHHCPHHPQASGRYGRRLAGGTRNRSREPPPVERAPSQEEKERLVEEMHREFSGRRKVLLNGLPMGCTEEVRLILS